MDRQTPTAESGANDFARQAASAPPGLVAEFVDFLLHNKKWWLTPIIVLLLLLGALVMLASSSGAFSPFIYTVW